MTSIHQDKTTNRAALVVDYNADGQTVLTIAPDDQPEGVLFTIVEDQLPSVLVQMAGGETTDRPAAEDIAEKLTSGTLEAANLTETVRLLLTGLDWATNGVPLPAEPVLEGEDAPAVDPDTADEQGRVLTALTEENEALRNQLDNVGEALTDVARILNSALNSLGRDA